MMTSDPEREHWLRRLDATGRAQARYLWLSLVVGLFFAALRVRGVTDQNITVPLIDLELDAAAVLAAGSAIIAFLVLATMGTIRAWTHALEQYRGTSPATDAEQLDTSPNALDLAVYTTAESPWLVRAVLSFVYPAYLTVALIESAWLAVWVWNSAEVPFRWPFLTAAALTWAPAAFLVWVMWAKRVGQLRWGGGAV